MITTQSEYTPTWIKWYNDASDPSAKIACINGKYEDILHGFQSSREFYADGKPPHPVYGQFQWGLACSVTSRTIILDGDYPDLWAETDTGKLLGPWRDVATSIREVGDGTWKFHVVVIVPPELVHLWPKQLTTKFGHIKSNGFSYIEGVHAKGTKYVSTKRNWLIADEALMRAFLTDNGGVLHTDRGAMNSDSLDDEAATWTDPDGDYPQHLAGLVLGNWDKSAAETGRNASLMARCGIIKGAGEYGTPGMRTLYSDLCSDYDTETGRGEGDVLRAFQRCSPSYGYSTLPFLGMPQPGPISNGSQPMAPPISNGSQPAGEVAPVMAQGDPHNHTGTSDQSCARMVLEMAGQTLRYARDADTWLLREPECWTAEKTGAGAVIAAIRNVMPAGHPKAKDDPADDPEVKLLDAQAKRKAKFGSTAGAQAITGKMKSVAMLSAAGAMPMAVRLGDLDQDTEILWAGGVPYDLRASVCGQPVQAQLDPATPHMHHTRFVPDMRPTPLWDRFLYAVWPWEDLRSWAIRVLSVGMTGRAGKCLPILLGETDHGKTTVVKMIADALGTYALGAADPRLLSAADRAHASIVYALRGRRLTLIDEAPRTGQLAQERVKALSGGGELTGNRMGENPVTFRSTHTLVLTANPEHEPKLTDSAVQRRVRMIPCDGDAAAVVAACRALDTDNPGFSAAWAQEGPGVLGKMVVEAGRYLADPASASNAAAPPGVKQLVAGLIAEQCQVTAWLEAECEPWPPGTQSTGLHEQFLAYAKRHFPREDPYNVTKWGKLLTAKGYPADSRRDAKYRALRVRPWQPGVSGYGR